MGGKVADCCCCSKCGVRLPEAHGDCCVCVCDALCVTITDNSTGTACNCVTATKKIDWDATECAWIGTIDCGEISVDLRFEVRQCGDPPEGTETGTGSLGTASETAPGSNCTLCLTSTCLNLTAVCPDSGTGTGTVSGCKPFRPGNTWGECGKYIRDCDQSGGFNETWTLNVDGCVSGTAQECTDVSITAECYPRVNPAGSGSSRICKNCDCVCETVCIEYEEFSELPGDECGKQTQEVTWAANTGTSTASGSWTATFTGCPGGSQTVTVDLVRDEATGCCKWRLTTSRGVIIIPPAAGSGTAVNEDGTLDTDCPNMNLTWRVNLDTGTGTGTGTPYLNYGVVTVTCADCNGCGATFCCCPNDPIPDTLYATFGDDDLCCNCAEGVVIGLSLTSTSIDDDRLGGVWEGSGTICGCTANVTLECDNDQGGCFWKIKVCMGGGDCVDSLATDCAGTTYTSSTVGTTCDPLNLVFPPGNSQNQHCCCENTGSGCVDGVSGNMNVTVTE